MLSTLNDSKVRVAEGSAHSAHGISNSNLPRVCVAQCHLVSELRGWSCWVRNNSGTVDSVGARRRVEVLPCPPDTVNLSVMEVEPIAVSFLSYGSLERMMLTMDRQGK